MTDRKVMQMALDCMLAAIKAGDWKVDGACDPDYVLEALRTALAQGEQEPVAWLFQHEETGLTECVDAQQVGWGYEKNNPRWQKICPLYTTPPEREWQSLTNEDIEAAFMANTCCDDLVVFEHIARAIEAKLKEKNGY